LVRAVGDPRQRFEEDFLRILRAIRFAARFDFAIDPPTWAAARAAAAGLRQLSAERVRDEWVKGLQTARSVRRLVSMWIEVGAARVWLPELEADRSETLPEPPADIRDPTLLTALLTARPSGVLRRLKASNVQIERARAMEEGPTEPSAVDLTTVRRWMSQVGPSVDDLTTLWRLRHGAEAPWTSAMMRIRQNKDPLTRSELAISGSDLLALGVRGPDVGQTLTQLLNRVLEEPSLNNRDGLLALAREMS